MSIAVRLSVTSLVFIDMLEEYMREEPKSKLPQLLQHFLLNRKGRGCVRKTNEVHFEICLRDWSCLIIRTLLTSFFVSSFRGRMSSILYGPIEVSSLIYFCWCREASEYLCKKRPVSDPQWSIGLEATNVYSICIHIILPFGGQWTICWLALKLDCSLCLYDVQLQLMFDGVEAFKGEERWKRAISLRRPCLRELSACWYVW